MIFVGGQVSLDTQGQAIHPDDLPAQTHAAMQHIDAILQEIDDLLCDSNDLDADIVLRRIRDAVCGKPAANSPPSQNQVMSTDTR